MTDNTAILWGFRTPVLACQSTVLLCVYKKQCGKYQNLMNWARVAGLERERERERQRDRERERERERERGRDRERERYVSTSG